MSGVRRWRDKPTLASLARTRCAFKEPALNLLWEELRILTPLARCLPEASHFKNHENVYSFNRPLKQTEWDTLQSYTRRIRSILHAYSGLDWESVVTFLDPPATRPLFPNLRMLSCDYRDDTMALLNLPLPSLISLQVTFQDSRLFQSSLELFPKDSLNIRKINVFVDDFDGVATFSKIEPNYICRWQNLTSVICRQVALDVHELVHLSRMPALTELHFMSSATLSPFDSPLFFPSLHNLTLVSQSLKPISRLLSQIWLPVVRSFTASIRDCPSRPQLTSFWASFRAASTGHTVERLKLTLPYFFSTNFTRSEAPLLGFEDLQPCLAFSNLRLIDISVGWNVDLTDDDLLTLASAWPCLEDLFINMDWGWNTTAGITPNGLLRLLESCRIWKKRLWL
ncbi:hypothetical protein L210DRAFT_984946 [Boletus edulis BED1]|uniref:F-box domain-containing protein n=1 Tax=Boletus edulis BED1 TaxID=1328754 RepID=A0AAD4GEG6_BOLED|nr:hypothetical protein L210DRAFT_984946 [Boletus edulis BED1]